MFELAAIAVVVVLAIFVIVNFNRLITLRNHVETGWAQIAVQLQRRTDLIPNLVATVKGSAAHESQTLENVTAARTSALAAQSVPEKAAAEGILTGALKSLFAVAEDYPELKANANFLQLQEELTETEDRIAYSRQYYNDAVRVFNTAIQSIPGLFFAPAMRLSARPFFEATTDAQQGPVKVDFS